MVLWVLVNGVNVNGVIMTFVRMLLWRLLECY